MILMKNCDCMDYMATLPDKSFAVAIVTTSDSTSFGWKKIPNIMPLRSSDTRNTRRRRRYSLRRNYAQEITRSSTSGGYNGTK